MTRNRGYMMIAALVGASMIAACSSSTMTAPSTASLAQFFDSAYVADSSAGFGDQPRALVENYLALMADEGLSPVPVLVKTDGGTLQMQMMAAVSYDTTAAGLPADSLALVVGWTSDYSKYFALVTEAVTSNGPRVNRVPLTPARFTMLTSMLRGTRRTTHDETALADLMPLVFVVDGENADVADSTAGDVAWSGGGSCKWQHVVVSHFAADSTIACTQVRVAISFAFHFPTEAGIDTSLSHMSISTTAIPGVRLVGFDGF